MTLARQRLGRRGEDLAAARLLAAGWRIIERNARPAGVRGELDIVAHDGRDLVFVEVKTVRSGSLRGPADPTELVGREKLRRLRALAGAWTREHRAGVPRAAGIRIDVVALTLDGNGRVARERHIRGVG